MDPMVVIDGDGHVVESLDGVFDFVEGRNHGELSGTMVSPFPWIDGAHSLVDPKRWVATDAASWREMMDYTNIEEAVLYPTAGLAHGIIENPEWAAQIARAYNRWVYATHLEPEPRLHAPALLPSQDVSSAVEELRYAVQELRMVGGILTSVTASKKPYGDAEFEPIYDEAERLDVPLIIHGGSNHGLGLEGLRRTGGTTILHHAIPLLIHLTSMTYAGVFERHPSLRVGFFEAGSSWVAYMMDRLDKFATRGHASAGRATLGPVDGAKRPSEVLAGGSVFVTCDPDERFLPVAVEALGEGRVLYATDYPHEGGDVEKYSSELQEIASREDLSESARRSVLSEGARLFYGLTNRVSA